MQTELYISQVSHDDSNQTLDKLQAQIDFDLNLLTKSNKKLLLNFIRVLDKANTSIEAFKAHYLTYAEYFEATDLKLHDLAYEISEEEWDNFNWFCTCEFDYLKECYDYENLIDRIGSSSKFVYKAFDVDNFVSNKIDNFYASHKVELLTFEEWDNDFRRIDLCNDYMFKVIDIVDFVNEITETNHYTDQDDVVNDFKENILIAIDDLRDISLWCREYDDNIKETKEMADYIKEFKENQIENYKQFNENN